ncbi:MAG: DsbA family protein [Hyphomicrobiaceae bacterium]
MMTQSSVHNPHLLYVADPMCSWCYGFSPVIGAVAAHFGDRLPIRLLMGGLRAGNTQAMREQDREYIRNAWTRVGAATGQPFDFAFFDRETFTYDTEPACRAVVVARTLNTPKALGYMAAVQRGFYGANRDTTNAEVLVDIAAEEGFDRPAFVEAIVSPDIKNATFRDFLVAQQAGIQGFPALLASRGGDEYALVTNGYRPLDGLIEALEDWMAVAPPASANDN